MAYTLDDIRAAAQKKYPDVEIENGKDVFILPHPVRLDDEAQEALRNLSTPAEEEGDSTYLGKIQKLVVLAEVNGRGEELVELLGDDVTVYVALSEAWFSGVELGE